MFAQVEVVELTAQRSAEGYANGGFTAVDVTQSFLDRIQAYEPNYNAFVSFAGDALDRVASLDRESKRTGRVDLCGGVPIAWTSRRKGVSSI